MKTPPPQLPAKGKVPKAHIAGPYKPGDDPDLLYACIPCATPQQAAQLVRFMRLDEEGRVEAATAALIRGQYSSDVAEYTIKHRAELFKSWQGLARALLLLCGIIQ